jgi:hypothetical protein
MMPTLHFIAKGALVSQEFQSSLAERNIFSADLLTGGKKPNGMSIFVHDMNYKQEFLKSACNIQSYATSARRRRASCIPTDFESEKIDRRETSQKGLVVPQSAFVHNQ